MALVSDSIEGWRINLINIGPPYVIDIVGNMELPQVCDERLVVALSGPGGAVFCASMQQAQLLCDMANAGKLERVG